MKINQLASKPKLIVLQIDDADVVAEYGEPIEFWTWDRQPLETFMKLASVNQSDPAMVIDIVRTMILDEKGKQVIQGEDMLPTNILVRIVAKVVETLGK
jgi:hypothetical protein